MNELMKATIAEFVGTFTLVFIGAAAVTVVPDAGGVVVPAFAHGLTVLSMIYVFGHISGTHINPAVTVGLLIGGHVNTQRAIYYIVAQFLGGVVAALLLAFLLGGNSNMGETTGSLTDGALLRATVFELVLTFFLVSAVYQAAAFGKAGDFAGIAIGLTLAGCILAGGPYTGASLNPSRTLGPALIAGNLGYVPAYLIGTFGGGILAGLLHQNVFKPE